MDRFDLVVIGGSALLALRLVDRTTRDVDLLAIRRGSDLVHPEPLPTPSELLEAARWTITHDPSAGFRRELLDALRFLGVGDADLGA